MGLASYAPPALRSEAKGPSRDDALHRLGTVLLPLMFLVLAYWWAPPAGSLDFFATCSQIIPVVLLALVLEFRLAWSGQRWP